MTKRLHINTLLVKNFSKPMEGTICYVEGTTIDGRKRYHVEFVSKHKTVYVLGYCDEPITYY